MALCHLVLHITVFMVCLGCIRSMPLGGQEQPTIAKITPPSATEEGPINCTKSSNDSTSEPTTESTNLPSTESTSQPSTESTRQRSTLCPSPWLGYRWRGNSIVTYRFETFVNGCRKVCRNTTVYRRDTECVKQFSHHPLVVQRILIELACDEIEVQVQNCYKENITNVRRIPIYHYERLSQDFGFFKANASLGIKVEQVWQFEAPAGHEVYIELTGFGNNWKADDTIHLWKHPCLKQKLNTSLETIVLATGARYVQLRLSTPRFEDSSRFKGAYYYYPSNESIDPFEVAQRRLKEKKSNLSSTQLTSNGWSKRRRRSKERDITGIPINTGSGSTMMRYKSAKDIRIAPLTSRRLLCVHDILWTERAGKYINDRQCGPIAKHFQREGFLVPHTNTN